MAIVKKIRVLLVEDHTMVRQGLRSALQSYPNIEVVGEAGDGEEAVARSAKLQPAVIVMDINLPKMDGITATRLIRAQHPQIIVVGLTVETKDYQTYAMQKAGAFEVLLKDNAVTDLYGAIQRAVATVSPVVVLEESPMPQGSPEDLEITENQPTSVIEPKTLLD